MERKRGALPGMVEGLGPSSTSEVAGELAG